MSQSNPCPAQVEQFWLKETHEGNIFHGYSEHVVGPQMTQSRQVDEWEMNRIR